jgi:hypothetical protein
MYEPESENFAANATHLDTWVFEKLENLFERSHSNQTLRNLIER